MPLDKPLKQVREPISALVAQDYLFLGYGKKVEAWGECRRSFFAIAALAHQFKPGETEKILFERKQFKKLLRIFSLPLKTVFQFYPMKIHRVLAR